MPVYNERERVERAIDEVLATELPTDFELILINDGSTDGTTEILRRVTGETTSGCSNTSTIGQRAAIQRGCVRPRASSRRSSTPTWSTTPRT